MKNISIITRWFSCWYEIYVYIRWFQMHNRINIFYPENFDQNRIICVRWFFVKLWYSLPLNGWITFDIEKKLNQINQNCQIELKCNSLLMKEISLEYFVNIIFTGLKGFLIAVYFFNQHSPFEGICIHISIDL